jgi:RNA polymerase sigma-70 factor (ECF subfamily)
MHSQDKKHRLVYRLRSLFTLEFTRRLHEGEPREFERIYDSFRHPLRNWLNRKLPSPELSEDITQEVFLKVWRHRRLFSPAFDLSTWIWSIARNTLIDLFRRNQWNRVLTAGVDHPDIDPVPLIETLPHPSPSAENELSSRIEKARLNRSLASLTELQREALSLRLVEQLSYEEIARRLSLSLSSVKGLIFRARQKLLEDLRGTEAPLGGI